MSRIAERARELAQQVTTELGLELFGVEYVKEGANWVLRVTIDAEAGISHAECEATSRKLEALLDAADVVPGAYMLEVSSPGAERPLRDERDFVRFAGRRVLVKTFAPVAGHKEWTGTLLGVEEGQVRIQGPKGEQAFPRDQVSLIRLSID